MNNKIWFSPVGISEGFMVDKKELRGQKEGEIVDWKGEEMENGEHDRQEFDETVNYDYDLYLSSWGGQDDK